MEREARAVEAAEPRALVARRIREGVTRDDDSVDARRAHDDVRATIDTRATARFAPATRSPDGEQQQPAAIERAVNVHGEDEEVARADVEVAREPELLSDEARRIGLGARPNVRHRCACALDGVTAEVRKDRAASPGAHRP